MDEATCEGLRPPPHTRHTLGAWIGVLLPPSVFLTDLGVSYVLAHFACHTGRFWLTFVATPVSLLLIAASAVATLRSAAALPGEASPTRTAHSYLVALAGWSVALFALGVLCLALPRFILGPCQQY
jgi:hypothetical protein